MRILDIITETKQPKDAPKPRNFVAKNAINTGAGQHKDKKRAEKQGDVKHKKQAVPMDEEAGAATTTAANVAVGAVYKNKPAKQAKNKDGTAKNALDMKANLITGGSIKR
jgi:hypothetical protein